MEKRLHFPPVLGVLESSWGRMGGGPWLLHRRPLFWEPAEHVSQRPGCLEPAFSEASAFTLQIVELQTWLVFFGEEVGSQALEMGSGLQPRF